MPVKINTELAAKQKAIAKAESDIRQREELAKHRAERPEQEMTEANRKELASAEQQLTSLKKDFRSKEDELDKFIQEIPKEAEKDLGEEEGQVEVARKRR